MGATLGAIFGGLIVGFVKNNLKINIGKLKCMQLVCVLIIVAGVLTEIENEYSLAVGKFLLGVAAGSITVYVPKYIQSIAYQI